MPPYPQGRFDKKPCRVLFVRNVEYSTTENDIRKLFDPFGEIKSVFDLIAKRGAAQAAKEGLTGTDFNNRPIDIHYSTPKTDDLGKKCDKDKNQGTINIDLPSGSPDFVKSELHEYLSQFGELKDVRIVGGQKAYIEYWDSRSCNKAFDHIEANPGYKDTKIGVRIMWDDPPGKQIEAAIKTKQKPDDRRDNRRQDDRGAYNRRDDYNYAPSTSLIDAIVRGIPFVPPPVQPLPPVGQNNLIMQLMNQPGTDPNAISQILSLLGPKPQFPPNPPAPQGYSSQMPQYPQPNAPNQYPNSSYQGQPGYQGFPPTQGYSKASQQNPQGYQQQPQQYGQGGQQQSQGYQQMYQQNAPPKQEAKPYWTAQNDQPTRGYSSYSNQQQTKDPKKEGQDDLQLKQLAQLLMKQQRQ